MTKRKDAGGTVPEKVLCHLHTCKRPTRSDRVCIKCRQPTCRDHMNNSSACCECGTKQLCPDADAAGVVGQQIGGDTLDLTTLELEEYQCEICGQYDECHCQEDMFG